MFGFGFSPTSSDDIHHLLHTSIASYFFHFIHSSDSLSQQICYVYSSAVTVINTLLVIPYDIAYFQKYYNGHEKHGYHQQQKCCPIKR